MPGDARRALAPSPASSVASGSASSVASGRQPGVSYDAAVEQHGGLPEAGKIGAAFDPRTRLYRDPFNELVVFVMSALGAGVLVPTLLTLIGAFTGKLDFLPFVGLSVLLELGLIFGLLRPVMRPAEKLGWGLLWTFGAAVLGAAFWELTYIQLL